MRKPNGGTTMNPDLRKDLLFHETDLEGALHRFSGDEELYVKCLNKFLQDKSMQELGDALAEQSWNRAFTAAHALKGLAGNMGFVPLFHASAELVILIRAGRLQEIDASYMNLKQCYYQITTTIRRFAASTKLKGE